ncbi:hypothetical protein [Pseudomonas sp. p1(2021b)]|uniref:hypothetical protein n=1 Tax=Pseudomonas sp. p1(2021b) TaxID=2874628 RepID=UPI003D274EA8
MPAHDENVTIGVSSFGVFTIGLHLPIIHGCRQTSPSEQLSANESANYAKSKVSAKKPLPTGAA